MFKNHQPCRPLLHSWNTPALHLDRRLICDRPSHAPVHLSSLHRTCAAPDGCSDSRTSVQLAAQLEQWLQGRRRGTRTGLGPGHRRWRWAATSWSARTAPGAGACARSARAWASPPSRLYLQVGRPQSIGHYSVCSSSEARGHTAVYAQCWALRKVL